MMKRFDVLKKRLPRLIDTPVVFSTNPPKETFSSRNFSQSLLNMDWPTAEPQNRAVVRTLLKLRERCFHARFVIIFYWLTS
jgi:hypothetical protein